jgi:hypothetical protein
LSKNPIKENTRNILIKKSYAEVKPRLQTAITETRTRSRKPLRSVTSDREEDDCLSLKKKKFSTQARY